MLGLLVAAALAAPEGMVLVPAGSFVMGRDLSHKADETPAHRVTLSAFYLDQTLVTVAAWRRFVEETGHVSGAEKLGFGMVALEGMGDWEWVETPGATWRQPWGPGHPELVQGDDEPVVMVTWHDAVAYCEHQGKRLPTEAQWAYAMGAGAEGTRFPWGDTPALADGRLGLNYWQGADHLRNARLDGYLYTSPVRAFPPNAWGLYDPAGNTWQWLADWYGADTYQRGDVTDPTGPESGWARVARGGSWWCSDGACSAYGLHARGKTRPEAPFNNNGFRCAKDSSG